MANFWENDPEVKSGDASNFWENDPVVEERKREEPKEEPKEATASGEAVKSFKQMGSAYQTALGTFTGDPEAAVREGMKRQQEYIKQYGQARGLEEFTKAYGENGIFAAGAEALSQIPTALSGQAANLATIVGGGRLGAMVGAPLGPAGAAVGATIGAIGTQIIPFYQQNLEAQLRAQEERGEKPDLNRAKALAYAAVQSSAEIGGTALAFGKNLIGKIIGSKPAAEATETLVKAAKQSLLGAAGKGALRATGAEIPVEMAQTILQRHQAGESLTDADALEDYKNTVYSTVLVAGPLGAGAGPINRMQARGKLAEQELQKQLQQETEEEIKTETTQAPPVGEADIEKQIADIEAAGTTPPVDKDVIVSQGDQSATAQTDGTGAGVGTTVSGQPAGGPATGVVGTDGTGVAVTGDTSQQAQTTTTEQPSAVEALDFQAWLNKKGIPLTSITSQEQWDALQQEWNQETGSGSQQATPAVTKTPKVSKTESEITSLLQPLTNGGMSPELSSVDERKLVQKMVAKTINDGLAAGKTNEEILQQINRSTRDALGSGGVYAIDGFITNKRDEIKKKVTTPAVTTPAPVQEAAPVVATPTAVTAPAPIKTETETGLDVLAEKKIAKPIKYVDRYTPTPEPSANNFLNQNSTYGKEAPLTVDRGVDMAAADQAFDLFDSAYGKVLNRLRVLTNAKNKQEGVDGKYSFERPLEFMTANELIDLYKQNFGARKTFDEGGKARLDAAKNRAAFVESLTPEQRAKYDAALEKLLKQTVMAEASGRREATESDQRKQKEKQEKQTKKQTKKAVADVQEQVTEATKTDEQIAAEERAEAEAFIKQQETDKDKSDTADALKSEAQVETEAKTEAVKETKEEEKKVTKRDKRLMSAVNDSGDIKSVLEEIAGGETTAVSVIAEKLASVFKYLSITDPTAKRIQFSENFLATVGVKDADTSGAATSEERKTTKVNKKEIKKALLTNDGMFIPDANVILIAGADGKYTGKRDLGEVVLHEIMHYYTDHVIDNRAAYINSLDPEYRAEATAALNRLRLNFIRAKSVLGKEFNIPTIKEFIAETFSNSEFQQALKRLDAEGKQYKSVTKDNMFLNFVKNVMSALGIYSTNDINVTLKETLEDVMNIISTPQAGMRGRSVSYSTAPKTTNMGPSKPASLYDDDLRYMPEKFKTESLVTRIAKAVTPDWLVKKFQNDKQLSKKLENQLGLAGKLKMSGEDRNDSYTIVSLARGISKNLYNEKILPGVTKLETAFNELSKLTKLSNEKLVALIDKVSIAKHEPERRIVKFLKTAPLKPQMADVRQNIFKLLDSNTLSQAQAVRLRKKLDAIMFQVDQNGNPVIGPDGYPVVNTNNVTPLGNSPRDFKTTDVSHADYTVVDMDGASVKNINDEYNNHPQKALIDRVLAAQQEIINSSKELNQTANYVSDPVNNLINFYGWKNYVPMKARFEADGDFDPAHRGREEQENQYSFEGMDKVPDSPLLYVLSDGARAASRAGREGYTLSIKNNVLQGNIRGAVPGDVKNIPFDARDTELKKFKKASTIFHYNKDGSVDVITIKDPAVIDSLRRTYKDSNPLVDAMNIATGFVGKMHTRYNYAFAPMNFVRDALTNSFVLGADFGPGAAAEMLGAMAAKVGAQGGLYKAMRIANMYENGDVKGMRDYASKDAFAKTIVEYLLKGGATAYTSSIALKDQLQELNKELGRGKIIKTRDQLEKFVDVWNNMFEFSSRAAAYGVVKDRFMSQGMSDADAAQRAVGYVKNLANFEQTGEYGKMMGGLFMFFRPAATGAVRAIEAVVPAFPGSLARAVAALPKSIRDDTQALARFEKAYAQKQQSARIMVTSLMGLGMMMYYMSAMMSPEDELGRNSVHSDNMKQWSRYARFHIPNEISEKLGMGKDVVFQMPWGFGLGAFAAAGAQIAAAEAGRGTLQEALKNIFTDIALDSFVPLPISKMDATDNPINFLIDSISPSIARPLLQFALNKDGLGRGIYNEPYRRMADAFGAGDRIPEAYKDAARYVFNEMGVDVNPNSLYFLSNSYFDGVGRLLETVYSALGLSGEKPDNIKRDSLLFGSFFGSKGNVDNREWGEVQSQLMKKQANLNGAKTDPEAYFKYMERNPMDEVLVKSYLKDVNGSLKKLQTEAKQIRMMPGLSPKERQEMLEPNRMMQSLIKSNLVEKYKMYGINP
jgi:hypothetical protein